MNKILTWQEIEKNFSNQWIQLVDFEWLEGESRPQSGRVRICASSRKVFNRLVLEADPVNAARIFVGQSKLPENTYLSANAVKPVPCG